MKSKKRFGVLILTISFIIIIIGAPGCTSSLQSTVKSAEQPEKIKKVALTKDFKFDRKKTQAYVQTLEGQKSFPFSVTYAHYYVYSMEALGSELKDNFREKAISFITKCQLNDGGFGWDNNAKSSDIYSTYCAVWTLHKLNALEKIEASKAEKYIKSHMNKDGGFGFAAGQNSDPVNTYYCVAMLDALGKLSIVNKSSVVDYINTLKTKQGGFALRQGIQPNLQSTYAALQTLKLYDSLSKANKDATISFLLKTQAKDGGFYYMIGDTNTTNPERAYYALSSLRLLGALEKVKVSPLSQFLKDRYVGDGGFCDVYYGNSKYTSTYYAIACLAKLGYLKSPAVSE